MSKKKSPRELREARKAKMKEKYASKAVEKKEVIEEKAAAEPKSDKNKKSLNKAAGLKSVFYAGENLYMTSFGRGNTAVVEQKINTSDYSFSSMNKSPNLRINNADEINVSFSSTRPFVKENKLTADNPLHEGKSSKPKATGKDILGLKDTLEKRYFGKVFDDNIHIQIIYNILDIEKILAEYITNISVSIDHLCDEYICNISEYEFIGYMSTRNTFDVFCDPSKNPELKNKSNAVNIINSNRDIFEKLIKSNRLGYFGFEKEDKKRLYHLMALAGQLRQWCFHDATYKSNDINKEEYVKGKIRTWLYNLDNHNLAAEYYDTLDYFFDKRFKEINNDFVSKNSVNLFILKDIFPEEELTEVIKLYYDFIVVKSYKNMGFSITKLREKMLEQTGAAAITSTDMDSVRSKLYKLIDFCILYGYYKDEKKSAENVDYLRSCLNEDAKENFYAIEAQKLWEKYGNLFLDFCNIVSGTNIKRLQNCDIKELDRYIDFEEYRNSSNVSYFSKLMYVMCFFLDGKEINELLTTLINKFDNISSFIATAKELDIDVNFVADYSFFNDCGKYVNEINIVKNISRMKKPSAKAKKVMFRDSLTILGMPYNMTEEQFEAEIEKLVKVEYDEVTGEKIKKPHDYRNFICNNIIENRRFVYIIKFCNPGSVRKIADSTAVTKFVLKRIDEKQIERYYISCMEAPDVNASIDYKINQLAEMMKRMDFGQFSNVRQKPSNPSENQRKERYKAIVGLYLTVVYHLVKNLVNVNARYVMAFHSLERDAALYNYKLEKNYTGLAKLLCDEEENSRSGYLARNKRLRECVKQDIENAKELDVQNYRNNVAHLTAIRRVGDFVGDTTKIDSYFALYHYLMQRLLLEKSNADHKYNKQLIQWHTYVKDYVKALNSPFGYNIPRFKALTIESLFDRNE